MAAGTLSLCTLTGVDESVDLEELAGIADLYPHAEFGILLSRSRSGIEARYPSFDFIRRLSRFADEAGFRAALHVCGSAVTDFVRGDLEIRGIVEGFGRVQLNFNARCVPFSPSDVGSTIDAIGGKVITQGNPANEAFNAMIDAELQVLFDSSGGRGLVADRWPSPVAHRRCGYAGGIRPDSVAETIASIAAVCDGETFWIDMESSLRDATDRFDLELCREALRQAEPFAGRWSADASVGAEIAREV